MKVGDRVKTKIRDFALWSRGEHFNGKVGTIEEILTHERMTGFPIKDPRVLVRFDVPLAPSWTNGSEHTAFWYCLSELETL